MFKPCARALARRPIVPGSAQLFVAVHAVIFLISSSPPYNPPLRSISNLHHLLLEYCKGLHTTEAGNEATSAAKTSRYEFEMAGRVVVVLGACGNIGSAVVKVLLENSVRVVAVSRGAESLADLCQKLGNPTEDKLVTVQGNVSSDEDAEELRKAVLAKVGTVTDVVYSIGKFWQKGPIMEQSLEEFRKVATSSMESLFMAAKAFIPLLADQEGASFLALTGGSRPLTPEGVHALLSGKYESLPNSGLLSITAAGRSKMMEVLFCEYEGRPIRINEFSIYALILPVEMSPPGAITNMDIGRAVASVIMKGVARSQVICVTKEKETLEKIVKAGK